MVAGVGLEPHDLRVSHKASPCLPLRNIVALLAWSASHCSLFLHLTHTPSSAAGSGVWFVPTSTLVVLITLNKNKPVIKTGLFMVAGVGLEPHDLRVMSPTSYQLLYPAIFTFLKCSNIILQNR